MRSPRGWRGAWRGRVQPRRAHGATRPGTAARAARCRGRAAPSSPPRPAHAHTLNLFSSSSSSLRRAFWERSFSIAALRGAGGRDTRPRRRRGRRVRPCVQPGRAGTRGPRPPGPPPPAPGAPLLLYHRRVRQRVGPGAGALRRGRAAAAAAAGARERARARACRVVMPGRRGGCAVVMGPARACPGRRARVRGRRRRRGRRRSPGFQGRVAARSPQPVAQPPTQWRPCAPRRAAPHPAAPLPPHRRAASRLRLRAPPRAARPGGPGGRGRGRSTGADADRWRGRRLQQNPSFDHGVLGTGLGGGAGAGAPS
jgi:hypothetical protein